MTAADIVKPRLRAVEIIPAEGPQGQVYLLRDPLGIAAEDAAVPPPALFIMQFMDGTRTREELAREFEKHTGHTVALEQVETLTNQLDEKYLLEGERFEAALEATREAYRQAPGRPSLLAGASIPAQGTELSDTLNRILAAEAGPEVSPQGEATGLVAPHIDLERGAAGYGHAYGWLAGQPRPDRVVILGTSHNGASLPLVPTTKDFITPLGRMPVDSLLASALEPLLDREVRDQEFLHLREHSLEFQVLFLQHLFPGNPPPMLPFLTGPLPEGPGGTPGGHPELEELIEGLARAVSNAPGRTLCIAGADLAHLGPDFGDQDPLTTQVLAELDEADRRSLQLVQTGDAEGFYRDVAREGNPRRICGLSPIYLLMRLLPHSRGSLLCYGQATAEEGSQCVSFASLAFTA